MKGIGDMDTGIKKDFSFEKSFWDYKWLECPPCITQYVPITVIRVMITANITLNPCTFPSLPSVKCMNINNCTAAWIKAKPKMIVILAFSAIDVYRVTNTAKIVKTIEPIKPTVCFTIVFIR